jgi:serine/threonine protein kinase
MQRNVNQVESLFDAALALDPDARAAFLRDASVNAAIRAEVMSLLSAYDEANDFLDDLADSVVTPIWDDLAESGGHDPLQIEGTTLGRYQVCEYLGGGGMGMVYRAIDTSLNRAVALKFLSPHLSSVEEAQARFLREAQTASALDHPNLATIFEISSAEIGPSRLSRQFIAMGYYEGETLKEKLERGALPVDEALRYAAQMASGLVAAHESGIIHRDIKPANIIVTERGEVRLVDFGLARALSEALITNPGRRMGTAAYMSPEQALGREVGARADIWSLGVTLYEMLTGERAFHRDHETSTVYAIAHEDPPLISSRRSDVPRSVTAIIERCLEKNPDDRYENAAAVLLDLEAACRGEPVSVRPSSRGRLQRTIAVLPFETLGEERSSPFTAGVHSDILTRLSTVSDLHVISRTSAQRYHRSALSIPEIGRELHAGWIVEGEVAEANGRVRVNARLVEAAVDRQNWAGNYERKLSADELFDVQAEITAEIASALQAQLSSHENARIRNKPTHDLLAYRLCVQARRQLDQRTEKAIRRAVDLFRQATLQDPEYALAWSGLADAYALLYDYGHIAANQSLPQAEAAVRRALDLDPDLAEAHTSLGLLHSNRHDGPATIRALKRAVELQPSYAEAHNWLSWNYQLLGNGREALASARRAVELDPLSPEAVSNLSISNLHNNNIELALAEGRRTVELQPEWTTGHFSAALALQRLNRHEEAVATLEGRDAPWAGVGLQATRCLSLLALGDETIARSFMDECRAMGQKFAFGLMQAAFHKYDEAFHTLLTIERWDDWPTLSVHFFYSDVLGPLRSDDRWTTIRARVWRARGLNVADVASADD